MVESGHPHSYTKGYEAFFLAFVLHNFRHNRQIEEVMANPNFPKSEKKVRPRP